MTILRNQLIKHIHKNHGVLIHKVIVTRVQSKIKEGRWIQQYASLCGKPPSQNSLGIGWEKNLEITCAECLSILKAKEQPVRA